MPIYEFYCADCHRIYNFLSRTINTTKRPVCPRCGREKLERLVSRVAIVRGGRQSAEQDDAGPGPDLPDVDEQRLERAMAELEAEADTLDEDNPRAMARMMRKLYDAAGLKLGPNAEEAIRRLEAGEDPDKIEEELGDVFDSEEELFGGKPSGGLRGLVKKIKPPEVDDTLYDL
jgi:putative FmdB family regulatory protein